MQIVGNLFALRGVDGGVILGFVFALIIIAGVWRVFEKAGEPGWAALIPIFNTIIILKIAGKPWWWLLLFLIPLVGIYFGVVATIDLAKSFGKGIGFAFGLIFLGFIFLPVLGFGHAVYHGPPSRANLL